MNERTSPIKGKKRYYWCKECQQILKRINGKYVCCSVGLYDSCSHEEKNIVWMYLDVDGKKMEVVERECKKKEKLIKIVSEDTFRSQPFVNQPNDMVRVVMDVPLRDWMRIKNQLEREER